MEQEPMRATLHYIFDPLCGWCYGAEPLVLAAATSEKLAIALHGGGLWPQPTRLPDETRRYIQQADARIAQMSGQPFGKAYLEGLLLDQTMVLESRPTIAAVLAAEVLQPGKGLPMLSAIQHAHYENGRRVVEPDVLTELAAENGLARGQFAQALATVAVDEHIAETRRLMQRIGAGGFPAFALELEGQWQAVPHQQFPADPAGFRNWLEERAGYSDAAAPGAPPSHSTTSHSYSK